jgi:hypothetical protein
MATDKLMVEEVLAFIERRTAELNEREDGAAPRPTESVVPAALGRATPTLQDEDTGIATISLRFDTRSRPYRYRRQAAGH